MTSQLRTQLLAALYSFLRVFVTALGSAAALVWTQTPDHDLSTWGWAGLWTFVGSVLLTAINALRSGDTRFGVGATGGK